MTFGPINLAPPYERSFHRGDSVHTLNPSTGQITFDNSQVMFANIPEVPDGEIFAGFTTRVAIPDLSTRLTFDITFSGIVHVEAAAFIGYASAVLKLYLFAKGDSGRDTVASNEDYIYAYFAPAFWGGGGQFSTTVSIEAMAMRPSRPGRESWTIEAGIISSAVCWGAVSQATASVLEGGITMISVSGVD
jgi:hypothetical protein